MVEHLAKMVKVLGSIHSTKRERKKAGQIELQTTAPGMVLTHPTPIILMVKIFIFLFNQFYLFMS